MHYEFLNKKKHHALLEKYCEECAKLGYTNNSSIQRLNLTRFKNSLFLIGLENERIVLFQGCHSLILGNTEYWRMGYRGSTIIKIKKPINNYLESPGACGIALLMMYLSSNYNAKRFIVSTNSHKYSKDGAGKSHKMDKILQRNPGHSLLYKNIEIFNTIQNVWELDKNLFTKYFWDQHIHNHTFEEGLIDA